MSKPKPKTVEQQFDDLFRHCDSYIDDRLRNAGLDSVARRIHELGAEVAELRRETQGLRATLDGVGKSFLKEIVR